MLSVARARRSAVGLSAALLVATGTANPAEASTDDAQQACGASPIDNESAYVPSGVRHSRFLLIATSKGKGNYVLNCGNGQTWGAVHIELKHEVPDWADAATCISKAIGHAHEVETSPGKYEYNWNYGGGTVVVVRGDNGIITAYPKGDGVASKWRTCSAS